MRAADLDPDDGPSGGMIRTDAGPREFSLRPSQNNDPLRLDHPPKSRVKGPFFRSSLKVSRFFVLHPPGPYP